MPGVPRWAGRNDGGSTQDYYLAGKDAPWWAVAGSIFGSNVSANHMVGMMAVGFGAGFVISHLEITAIAGLLLLCYFFLPVYRKLHIYTLSDYLNRRFDDRSRVAYAAIMVTIIVLVMMLIPVIQVTLLVIIHVIVMEIVLDRMMQIIVVPVIVIHQMIV